MSYRYWAINEVEDGWKAQCRCGWAETHETYWRARTATMSHYYACPMRWEIFQDDDAL